MLYRSFIRPFLFLFDPEEIHYRVFSWIRNSLRSSWAKKLCAQWFAKKPASIQREVFGLKFNSPIGLAAGFDKDAKLIDELACFGFGFIEVGTVTPKAQEGNPKPRLFRLAEDQALINRMGFNNEGLESMLERLKKRKSKIIVGGNIGKNKLTPNEKATDDYLKCFHALKGHVDYFVVNVSSPNTPYLRELQEKEPLKRLLLAIRAANNELEHPKPVLLKIAPDLTEEQLVDIVEITETVKLDGLIATNTTIDHSNLTTNKKKVEQIGAGGLSGKPLSSRSTEVIRFLRSKLKQGTPIIAVGGIFTAEDAIEKLEAGAQLVQVYTGFIYEGPGMIKKMNQAIAKYEEQRN